MVEVMTCRAVAVLIFMTLATGSAHADYCAMNAGAQDCGYPTLESCLQTVSGVGGVCIENPGRLPPNLLQRLRQERMQASDPPQSPLPPPVPPPPDE
jgi:hypothetical protein